MRLYFSSFTGLTPGDIQELPQATKRMIGSELRKVKGFAPWGLGVGPPPQKALLLFGTQKQPLGCVQDFDDLQTS